jgi:glutaconyl-CoA/methylmalonyl-CoA decarboxylase subunit gamma
MKDFKYTINGSQFKVEVLKQEDNMVELEVNGTPYTVEIERPAKKVPEKISRPASAPVTSTGAPVVSQKKVTGSGGSVKSPLPGIILDVIVKVGDTVKVGDKLMILEAMKMENTIASDLAGKVLDIKVEKGTSVLEGADLVIIG